MAGSSKSIALEPGTGAHGSPLVRAVVSYALIPNIFFLIAGHFLYFMRPVVNVDYLLVGGLAPFLSGRLSAALFALVFFNDLFVNLAPVYHFEVFEAFRWFTDFFYTRSFFSISIVTLVVTGCGIVGYGTTRWARRPDLRWRTFLVMASIGTLFSAADVMNGTSFLPLPASVSLVNFNIAYSGLRRSVQAMDVLVGAQSKMIYQPLSREGSATGELLQEAQAVGQGFAKRQIALVLVESLGLLNDPDLREKLMEKFKTPALRDRYDISFREVPFEGHTIQGEFRELCGVMLNSYGEEGIPKCLPGFLRERGYETVAFHGFTSQFYHRDRWYPRLGFERSYFAQEMQAAGFKKKCGAAFEGFCDTEVVKRVHEELRASASGKPKFVYWMTLNSHLPLDEDSARESLFDCSVSGITREMKGICLHTRMVRLVLRKISEIAADPALPPTEFILVGDHAPPFLSLKERSLYSPTLVPAVILRPKRR